MILSNISSEKYGDSTRPYFLGRYLSSCFRVTHFCLLEELKDNIKYEKLPSSLSFSRPLSIWKVVQKINKSIKKKEFKILYTHQLLYGIIGSFVKLMNPSLPFYVDFHSCEYFELKYQPNKHLKERLRIFLVPYLERFICEKSDKIITVSEETKNLLVNYYSIDQEKIIVIKNATDTSVISKVDTFDKAKLEKYRLDKKNNILAMFPNPRNGFVSNELAMGFLFEVAEKVRKKRNDIKFLILGGGKTPKISLDNVIFTGYVKDYNEWLNIADVCIATYPLNAVCGGVRNKICDYLAVGKPIIATKESMRGFDDLLPDIHYYECNTVISFSEKLIHFDKTDNNLNNMAFRNLKKSKMYSWDKKAEALIDVFNQV